MDMVPNDSSMKANFPSCELGILAVGVLGHEKYWRAKEVLKVRGTPILQASTGFSSIKTDFENFLQDRGHVVQLKGTGKPDGLLANALKAALKPAQDKVEQNMDYVKTKPFDKNAVITICSEAFEAGLSSGEVIALLQSEGYPKKQSGGAWTLSDIHSRRYAWKTRRPNRKTSEPKQVRAKDVLTALEQMELITKIMVNKSLSSDRKVQLAEEVSAGLITTENCVMGVKSPMISEFANEN
ncbi:MAG: hypothetical protein EOO77_22165 [Oxalobacteraceae bacterium]|nr:MAG: hypothetical protein EOO77_22165 [Oxalobacteraceae bacterium]